MPVGITLLTMPGEVIKKKATKTHSSHREHKTNEGKPRSSRQEDKHTEQRTCSGYRAHKFEKKYYQKQKILQKMR